VTESEILLGSSSALEGSATVETIISDVERFEAGAERADDITVLALRRV
jgi:serine phosphatase RsbU (regulator of sigma subunit)